MIDFIDYNKLQKLSLADKDVPLYKKIIKLQEECGEVAQEFLAWDDKQNEIKTNSSKSAEGTIEAVIEETCDVINVSIDILNALEMKYPELSDYISKRFQEKLDKWESKIQANTQTIIEDKISEYNISEDIKTIGNLILNSNNHFKKD